MIILKAEAALTVAEALTDDVARCVLAPPLWMSSYKRLCLCPALALRVGVEKPRPVLSTTPTAVAVRTTASRTMRRRRRTHLTITRSSFFSVVYSEGRRRELSNRSSYCPNGPSPSTLSFPFLYL